MTLKDEQGAAWVDAIQNKVVEEEQEGRIATSPEKDQTATDLHPATVSLRSAVKTSSFQPHFHCQSAGFMACWLLFMSLWWSHKETITDQIMAGVSGTTRQVLNLLPHSSLLLFIHTRFPPQASRITVKPLTQHTIYSLNFWFCACPVLTPTALSLTLKPCWHQEDLTLWLGPSRQQSHHSVAGNQKSMNLGFNNTCCQSKAQVNKGKSNAALQVFCSWTGRSSGVTDAFSTGSFHHTVIRLLLCRSAFAAYNSLKWDLCFMYFMHNQFMAETFCCWKQLIHVSFGSEREVCQIWGNKINKGSCVLGAWQFGGCKHLKSGETVRAVIRWRIPPESHVLHIVI